MVIIKNGKVLTVGGKVASHEDCCCGGCGQSCSNCSSTPPCCFKVVIAGVGEGTCGVCNTVNKTYYVAQSSDSPCTWLHGGCSAFPCDPTGMTLEVVLESGASKIRVTLGSHIWEKNYGTDKPDCAGLNSEVLTHTTSGGDCDSSSSTCEVTAGSLAGICGWGIGCCTDNCADGSAPDHLEIAIAGMVAASGPGECEDPRCTECMDGIYIIPAMGSLSGCRWLWADRCILCDYHEIDATLYKDGDDYKLKVRFLYLGATRHQWIKNFGTTKPNCMNLLNVSLTHDTDGDVKCSSATATCVVSSAHGGTTTPLSSPPKIGGIRAHNICANCDATPIEFLITITGVPEHDFDLCCIQWNDSFTISRIGGGGGGLCAWPAELFVCGGSNIITMGKDIATGTFMQIDLWDGGTAIWRKTYAAPTDCTAWLNEEYTYIAGESNPLCDWSNATLKVTAL